MNQKYLLLSFIAALCFTACRSVVLELHEIIGRKRQDAFAVLKVKEDEVQEVAECIYLLPESHTFKGFDFDAYLMTIRESDIVRGCQYMNTSVPSESFLDIQNMYKDFKNDYGEPFTTYFPSYRLSEIETVDSMEDLYQYTGINTAYKDAWYVDGEDIALWMTIDFFSYEADHTITLTLEYKMNNLPDTVSLPR